MKLATMTGREQVLILVSAAVLFAGAYGVLRYRPALKTLGEMQAQTKQTEERLKTTTIPDAPEEDAGSSRERMAEAEERLNAANTRKAELERNLPPADAQEVKLKISELVQAARLLVRENEVHKPGAVNVAAAGAAGGSSRAARRAARATARSAAATPAAGKGPAVASTPGIGLEMLERYSQPELTRPLQRVVLEGYYADIRYFIGELQKLPWQVTVAQLQLETDARPSEPGLPQPLRATLILAL